MDRPAIEALYRTHGAAVLRRARALVGSDTEAQEVLHDVFASLLQKPQQFAGQSSAMTFLYRMTTNAALQRLRSWRARQRLLASWRDPEPATSIGPQEPRAELRRLIARLPEDLAQLAVYYHLDEMTQVEIALVLGCSRQWVAKRLERLRRFSEGTP